MKGMLPTPEELAIFKLLVKDYPESVKFYRAALRHGSKDSPMKVAPYRTIQRGWVSAEPPRPHCKEEEKRYALTEKGKALYDILQELVPLL